MSDQAEQYNLYIFSITLYTNYATTLVKKYTNDKCQKIAGNKITFYFGFFFVKGRLGLFQTCHNE